MAECIEWGCLNTSVARMRCKKHWRAWINLHPEAKRVGGRKWVNRDGTPKLCTSRGCEEPAKCASKCMKHYQQFYYYDRKGRDEGL